MIRRSGRRPATLKPVSAKRRRSYSALRAFHQHVMVRARGTGDQPICEVPWCGRAATAAHHVIKRSQGGAHDGATNGVALCGPCHSNQPFGVDAPYRHGKLVITNLAADSFRFQILTARDKWAARALGA